MSRRAALFALTCALVGLAVSTAAAYTHYHLLYDPTYRSFCDVSERISCTQVYASRFSTFRGVPVAVFGALGFAAAALLSIAGLTARQDVRESMPGYLFVLSTLSLAVVLYLGYASFFVLKAVCILCLATYAAVIGLFLVSGAATTFPMTTLPRRAAKDTRVVLGSPIALALAVLFFAGAATTLAFFPREGATGGGGDQSTASATVPVPTQDQRSEFERWYASQPRVPLVIPSEGAKVLVVKFQDFQCPPCSGTYLQYKPIFAKYEAEHPGAVRVVYKDFPLNRDCNDAVVQTLHPAACDAAVAVRLAAEQNRHDQMEEWLYTHQPAQTPPSVRQAAHDVGNVSDFDAKYPSVVQAVKSDAALGKQLGVKSTPTFFINGVKIEGGLPPQYFDQAIAYELQHAAAR